MNETEYQQETVVFPNVGLQGWHYKDTEDFSVSGGLNVYLFLEFNTAYSKGRNLMIYE